MNGPEKGGRRSAHRAPDTPGSRRDPSAGLTARTDRLGPARDTGGNLRRTGRQAAPTASRAPIVVDADGVRADLTARLLTRLAGRLGFSLSAARVVVDGEAARRTAPRGARGLMTGGVIWLHPDRYDPATASGRALLAHEATHLAQRTAGPAGARRTTIADAEAEAARTAADFAEGRDLAAPVARLPESATAADTGAPATAGVLAGPRTRTTGEDVEVSTVYAEDIDVIRDRLGWPVGSDDVSYALAVLDRHPLRIALTICAAVGIPYLDRLTSHLSDAQRRSHRQSVLACYGALPGPNRHGLGPRLFDGMDLSAASTEERAVVGDLLRGLPDSAFQEVLQGPLRTQILQVMQTPQPPGEERRPAAAGTVTAAAPGEGPSSARVRRAHLAARVGALLRDSGGRAVHDALLLLCSLLGDDLAQMPSTPTERPLWGPLLEVVRAMEDGGVVRRLIKALPEQERSETNPFGRVLLEVIRHRPVAANLAHLQDLLSYGFFGSLGGARDAWLAYQIVRRLPPADQDRWLRLDGGKWFRRLEDHIPDDKRDRYEGVAVERSPEGRLADVASELAEPLSGREGREVWTGIVELARRGVDEARAPGLLLRIHGAGERLPAARRDALRRAVVRRLDQLGMLSTVLVRLPDRFLLDSDNLGLVREIVGLRDTAHLRRQIDDLISRNFWSQIPVIGVLFSPWSLSAHEAFVAFQLVRALPRTDRDELAADGRWEALTAALTEEMRRSAGAHLFTDRDGHEREGLQERLRDDRLWNPGRAPELRTLVRLAIELGLRRFVFERSRQTRAFEKAELRPMVEAFQLYAEPERTHYTPIVLKPEPPADLRSLIRQAGGWLWVNVPRLGRILGHARLDEDVVGVDGLAVGGGGRLTLHYGRRTGLLRIDLVGTLDLGPFDHVSTGVGLRVGRITLSGLHGVASFPAELVDAPSDAQLTLSQAQLTDLLVTGEDLLLGASRIVADRLEVHLGATGARQSVPHPPADGLGLPIPLVLRILTYFSKVAGFLHTSPLPLTFPLQSVEVTVGSLTFEGLAHGSGATAHSVRFENLFAGASLNRPAYLRALEKVLRRRLARERKRPEGNAERTRAIEQQLAQVDRSLKEVAESEEQLTRLRWDYVRDPGGLSAADRRKAAGLERALYGGAVIDAERIVVEGLDGSLRAKEVTFEGFGGEVEGPLLTPDTPPLSSVFVTDAERIAEFRKRGHPAGGAGADATRASLPLRAEKAVITDLAYLADIPSATSLRKQLDGLPPGTPATGRDQLATLLGRVMDYERVEERARNRQRPPLTPQEQLDHSAERDALRAHFGLRARTVEAQGVGVDLLLGPSPAQVAAIGAGAESVTAHDVTYGGLFTAKQIEGKRLGGTVVDDPAYGPGGLAFEFHAGEFTVQGPAVDRTGARADHIGVSGVTGRLGLGHDGPLESIDIPVLKVADATVSGIDYRGTDAWVHSEGVTRIHGVLLQGRATHPRADATAGWLVHLSHLRLDRVSAGHLMYERLARGPALRVEIASGSLLGVDVQGLEFAVGGGESASVRQLGRMELGGLDRLRFQVALGALDGSGTLTSVTPEGAPRVTGTLVVTSGTDAVDGGEQVDLRGLQLTQVGEQGFRTRNGRLSITRLLVGEASVHHKDGEWTVRGLHVPELRLGNLDWHTADDARLQSTGPTVLSDLRVNGTLRTGKDRPTRVHVEHLGVGSITAAQLAYHQDRLHLELGRRPGTPRQRGRAPLEIRDIVLRELDWTAERGVSSGTLNAASATAEFHGQLAAHLYAEATVHATSLAATFLANGHVALRVRGRADTGLAWADPGRTGATESAQEAEAHVVVGGLDTGVVDIGPESITFGPGTEPGLRIRDLAVDEVHYRSADLRLDSLPGGHGVILRRIAAKLRVELRSSAERAAAGRGASAIRRIVLREVGVEAIEADGIKVTLPHVVAPDPEGHERPVEIWIEPGQTGVLHGASLVLPADGVSLAASTSPSGGWVIPELELRVGGATDPVTGARTADALLIPELQARVAGILREAHAVVAVERIDVRYLTGGDLVLDLHRPSLSAIEAVFRSYPRHRLRIAGTGQERPQAGGVRAEHTRFDTRTGQLTATALSLRSLRYENAEAGAEVTVEQATVPDSFAVTLPGKGRAARGEVGELEIHGAWFHVDFSYAAPKPGQPLPWTATLKRLGPYERVFDSLQGRIGLTIHESESKLLRLPDTPVDLSVVDGRLEYRQMERQLIGRARGLLNFALHRSPSELECAVEIPTAQGSTRIPLAVWALDRQELRQAEASERIRIWRLLHVEGPARQLLDQPGGNPPQSTPSPIELRSIDLDVSLRSADPVPVDLFQASDGKIQGKITLARDALAGLRLTGDLPGTVHQQPANVAQARIDSVLIRLPGGQEARTGEIVVDKVSGVQISLDPSWSPRWIAGRIEHAVARAIVWSTP
ncbi:eCIS core domain-containing protein [Streptomyces sp. NPDC001135]